MALARLYDFTPATVIQSSQVDAEFNQLVNALNGGSTDKDITMVLSHASNAALTVDQRSTGPIQVWKDNNSEIARMDDGGVLKLGHTQPNGGGGVNHLLSNLSATIVGTSSEDMPHVLEGQTGERALDLIMPSGNTPTFLNCYERGSSTAFYQLFKHLMRIRAGGTQTSPISLTMTPVGSPVGYTNVTSVGNVGAGEDDLQSTTLAASLLVNSSDHLHVSVAGTTAANGNNKTIKIYFGGTAVFSTGVVTWNNLGWYADIYCVTYDTDKVRVFGVFANDNGTFVKAFNAAVTGLTLTNTQVLKLTGEATSNDDIVQHSTIIRKGTGA